MSESIDELKKQSIDTKKLLQRTDELLAAKEEIEFLHELIQSQRLYIQKLNEELDSCKEQLVYSQQDLVNMNKEVYELLMFNTSLIQAIEKCNCLQHKREIKDTPLTTSG